ncbi:glycosyltransferase family protein [Sulfitobacter sp. JB4-11]|uniref:glycosyltransferase family protein n=1 Tax=Sulfitobacter rhodophyticola TaxID=3238304 RepID=UPI0035196066
MKVLITVTHLLGTGHLARAMTLASAFSAHGHKVALVSGGRPVRHLERAGIDILQLPPVQSNGTDFSVLLDEQGNVITPDRMRERKEILLSILDRMDPDVIITELFPFGRRQLKDEFVALLEAARARADPPLIASSIRDILAPPSKPEKAALADRMIETYYDLILVHADPNLTPLELSWPVSEAIETKLRYTGFVAPAAAGRHPDGLGQDEIIVSAGGGEVGGHIFASALEAATQNGKQWRLLMGGADAQRRAAEMQVKAPSNVIIEPARRDFRQMLTHAAASVSMCGYNTALDVLQSGVPAVFVPFDAGNEVEQGIRAKALAEQNAITLVRNADLSASTLLKALEDVQSGPKRAPLRMGMDGANRTVEIMSKMWGARGGH